METNKSKPEHNPWYLLATLHGEASSADDEVHARNRTAWNRFMASELTEEARERLIKEGRCSAEELKPLTPEELVEVERVFTNRQGKTAGLGGKTNATVPIPNLKRYPVDFSNVNFDRPFLAERFLFPKNTFFSAANFSEVANFSCATFHFADFVRATFFGPVHFLRATFHSADFARATFAGWTFFSNATFSISASFARATFKGKTLFNDAKMEGLTTFEDARFSTAPPLFDGASLHQGTVWRSVHPWPLPEKHEEAGRFVDAYACLELGMDRLKKHEDELDFFALELQSRRVMHGDWQPVSELRLFRRTIPLPQEIPENSIPLWPRKLFGPSFLPPTFPRQSRPIGLYRPAPGLAIALYGWLSDYGRSYVRPLTGLLITMLVGILPFWWHLSGFWQAAGLSLANTFGVFGFRRELISADVLTALPGLLKVLAAAQTVAGIVLLFLLGLAIRNRFRMK